MNIPKQSNLTNQTFSSEFIEFVWWLPTKEESLNHQIIYKVCKNGDFFHEEKIVDANGYDSNIPILSVSIPDKDMTMAHLKSLKDEVIEYLK